MRKLQQLIAGVAVCFGAWSEAGAWTGQSVAEGTYYLYNVGTEKFLNGGDPNSGWGTHGWLTADWGIDVDLKASGEGYTIDTKFSNGGAKNFLSTGGWLDGAATAYIFTAVEGKDNVYTISSDEGYLTGTDASVSFAAAVSGEAGQQWQLVSREEMVAALVTATSASPMNATFLIKAPDFSRNDTRITSCWTVEANNKNLGGPANENRANYGCEFWNTTFDFHQVIADAPDGVYELKVQGFGTNGTTILYANDVEAPFANTEAAGNFKAALDNIAQYDGNTTGLVALESGSLTVGIKRTLVKNMDWTVFDNFSLTYYGKGALLDVFKQNLEKQVAVAKAVDQSALTKAAADALQKTIDEYDGKTCETSAEYVAAIEAVKAAVATANAVPGALAAFNATKDKVEAIAAQEVYKDRNSAKATFDNAVAAAVSAVQACATAEAIARQSEPMITAMKTFISSVDINDGKCFDLTALIANPSFDSNATDGWTYNVAPGYSETGKNAEYYEKTFDFSQTLTGMPKGNYKLKVQAFLRPGGNDEAYTAWKNGTDVIDTYIYINSGKTKIKNVMSEHSTEALATEANESVAAWRDYKDADGHYHPNGMLGASLYFDKGMYENEILTSVDGDLKMGFTGTKTTQGWTLFDNFRLYYYGSSIPVTVSEAADFSVANDVENAKVTLKRTIKAGAWNTLVLPFDLTDGETKAAFGSDAQVALFSESSEDATQATVKFDIAATAAIAANTPVLLKTSQAGTEYTFEGRTIKALNGAEAKAAGTNFSLVGTYVASSTVPAGAYFISGGKLYRSEGKTTLKGTRAYIAPNGDNQAAKVARFFIGDNEATAIGGVLVERASGSELWTVSGQRVSRSGAPKGLYINNNKKVIIK